MSTTETDERTPAEKAEAVKLYAAHANGCGNIYQHTLGPLAYTPGMRYMADTVGAHWLLDLVASHQAAIHRKHPGAADFQVWRVMRDGIGWRAEAWADTPETSPLLARQRFAYSDWPDELLGWEFWVEYRVAMMKGER